MTDVHSPDDRVSALEALLFLSGEPMAVEALQHALQCSTEEVRTAITTLRDTCASTNRGIRVLDVHDTVQLVTAPDHAELLDAFLKSGIREGLTPATAETLAIVAYRGPIHRAGVEAIRGVNASFSLRLLTIRGLIERFPSPRDSRMYLYRITPVFLRELGLAGLQELPDYEAMQKHETMTTLQQQAEQTGASSSSPANEPSTSV